MIGWYRENIMWRRSICTSLCSLMDWSLIWEYMCWWRVCHLFDVSFIRKGWLALLRNNTKVRWAATSIIFVCIWQTMLSIKRLKHISRTWMQNKMIRGIKEVWRQFWNILMSWGKNRLNCQPQNKFGKRSKQYVWRLYCLGFVRLNMCTKLPNPMILKILYAFRYLA